MKASHSEFFLPILQGVAGWPLEQRMALDVYLDELQQALIHQADEKTAEEGKDKAAHRLLALVLAHQDVEKFREFLEIEKKRQLSGSANLTPKVLKWMTGEPTPVAQAMAQAEVGAQARYKKGDRGDFPFKEIAGRLPDLQNAATLEFLAQALGRLTV